MSRHLVVAHAHFAPADLAHRAGAHRAAEGLGHELAAEAVAEHRHVLAHRVAHQLERRNNPGQLVVHAHGPAHEHQAGEAPRIPRHRRPGVQRHELRFNRAVFQVGVKISGPLDRGDPDYGDRLHAPYYRVVRTPGCGRRRRFRHGGRGRPKTIKLGQTWRGITVIGVERERATVEIDGKRRVLQRGAHYRGDAKAAAGNKQSATLAADTRGHFITEGTINGGHIRLLVDTGATSVAIPAADAVRLGIDYRRGQRISIQTANGPAPAYVARLDRVSVGAIELLNVEAVVMEQGLSVALLGMSFLNRLEMKREGSTMTLTRQF